ncbi:MAG: hypothetical protein PHR56_03775 [Dehalococcoidales bacterium]|nr:hypothetical protein [Dehalococcoidales bacterium]
MNSVFNTILALIIGLMAPVLIWVGVANALMEARKRAKLSKTSCAIDSDCPPGFVCYDGRCMPQH